MNKLAREVLRSGGPGERRGALLRHEWKIAAAALGALRRRPLDLLTVLIAVPVFLLVARAWVASQPEQVLTLQAAAVGFLIAFHCVLALISRCAFHRMDGIMAGDAQSRSEQLGWALPLFGGAAALGVGYLFSVGAYRPAPWLAATLFGAITGFASTPLTRAFRNLRSRLARWLGRGMRRDRRSQAALVVLGTGVGGVLALAPLRPPVSIVATAVTSLLIIIIVARIDAGTVSYRAMLGHPPWRIVRSHILPLLAFTAPLTATTALGRHWGPPAVAAGIGLVGICILAVRTLAYQSFRRRTADWLVTGLIGAIAVIGLALPPAAALVLFFGIVWLVRRAATRRWLIA